MEKNYNFIFRGLQVMNWLHTGGHIVPNMPNIAGESL